MPIPTLEELKNVTVERLTCVPEEKDVNVAIEQLAAAHPQLAPVLLIRPSRKGDVAVIDFVGSIDGVEFPGGSGQDYPLELGSNSFIPGFEEQLENRNVGDIVNVRVPFPEDYHAKELAGKKAVFRCTIKALKQKKPAVLDDQFAKQFGVENMADLRKAIAEGIQENMDEVAFEKARHELMEKMADQFPMEAPEEIVKSEVEILCSHDPELSEEEATKIATRRAQQGMLLVQLANEHGITLTDEEVMEALKLELQKYGPQAPQILQAYRSNPQLLHMFRAAEMEKKTFKWLIEQVAVVEKTVSSEEFAKIMSEVGM